MRPAVRGSKLLPVLVFFVLLLSGASAAHAQEPSRLVGGWGGALEVGAFRLRLALHVEEGDGALKARLVSVDQGRAEIPAEASLSGDSVRVTIAAIQGSYTGRMTAGGDSIVGEWSQGGQALPLTFVRGADQTMTVNRPQEPKPPYPYRAEEVAFASAAEGVTLAGTLTIPEGAGPHPAVVLVTGSGPQDRDETLLGHRPFLVLADHLSRRGIAVLRYDDRGVGESTGDFGAATSQDFASDAEGAVRFLRTRPEVDAREVGIMGHSEGALVAPIVAARTGDVAFLVLLAGPGVPGDSILRRQVDLIARAGGEPAGAVERGNATLAAVIAAVRAGGDSASLAARLDSISDAYVAGMSEAEKSAAGVSQEAMRVRLRPFTTPWYRYFLTYDPRPALRKVRVPVLAVGGALDLQVPSRENLGAIEAELRAGGNRDVRTAELPGLNHLFQTAKTGAPGEYGEIEETFAPAALEMISAWIRERFVAR